MFTIPNLITLFRFPLALVFLMDNTALRMTALLLAMISDTLDGFYARYCQSKSRLGTLLDPLADKFFVIFVLTIFLTEERLQLWEAATMLCRDFSVFIFGLYLACKGTLSQYKFRAILCGKIMTALQFAVLIGLVLGVSIPPFLYFIFIFIGLMALIELYRHRKENTLTSSLSTNLSEQKISNSR